MDTSATFKQRLRSGEKLLGTFVKTPSSIVCEVLGLAPLDAICIDAEHAPFDRMAIDSCVHALRKAGMPSLVRIAANRPEHVLNALDCGATGIVAPHVMSAKQAEKLVKACHFGPGGRGYAGSSRAAGFMGRPISQHLQQSAEQTTVIAQVEDIEAVDAIDEIASVEGIDCLFVGRIDLTVALGVDSPQHARVIEAVEKVCDAARAADRTVGMYVADVSEAATWMERGASLFLLESDHSLLVKAAGRLREVATGCARENW